VTDIRQHQQEPPIDFKRLTRVELSSVSEAFRVTGVDRRLSGELDLIARAAGDTEMVVSATPSENTVRFSLIRSYELMARPLPELYELEPEDVHL